ncbi:MAG TPA: hypothetical protein VH054_28635 [Polyangiaceae bacterium]|jgi:hypothetical protein|nr:hypothetical protein [Polyangiaceae bacterium]
MRAALFLFAFSFGCGDPGQLGRSVVAPSEAVSRVALADVPVTGAEVTVVRDDETKVTGELLEVSDVHLVILKEHTMVRIESSDVRRVIVTRYESGTLIAILTIWAGAGAIGQASHGVFAAVTEPIWGGIAAGAIVPVAADEGRFAHVDKRADFVLLREYARFPQGLPPQYAKAHPPRD